MSSYEERMGIPWYRGVVTGLFQRFCIDRITSSRTSAGTAGISILPLDQTFSKSAFNDYRGHRPHTTFGCTRNDQLSCIRSQLDNVLTIDLPLLGISAKAQGEFSRGREDMAQKFKYHNKYRDKNLAVCCGGLVLDEILELAKADLRSWIDGPEMQGEPPHTMTLTCYPGSDAYYRPGGFDEGNAKDFLTLVRNIHRYSFRIETDSSATVNHRPVVRCIFTIEGQDDALDDDKLAETLKKKWYGSEKHIDAPGIASVFGTSFDEYDVLKLIAQHGVEWVHAFVDEVSAGAETRLPGIKELFGSGDRLPDYKKMLHLFCSEVNAPMVMADPGRPLHIKRLAELTLNLGEERAKRVAEILYGIKDEEVP